MQAPQVWQSEALVNAQNRAAQAGTQVATDMAEQDTRKPAAGAERGGAQGVRRQTQR